MHRVEAKAWYWAGLGYCFLIIALFLAPIAWGLSKLPGK